MEQDFTVFSDVQQPTTFPPPPFYSPSSLPPSRTLLSPGGLIGHIAPHGAERRRSRGLLGQLRLLPLWSPPQGIGSPLKHKASCYKSVWSDICAPEVGCCEVTLSLTGVVFIQAVSHGRCWGWGVGMVLPLSHGGLIRGGVMSIASGFVGSSQMYSTILLEILTIIL